MAERKYSFNPEKMRYETIEFSFSKKLLSLLPYFISILLFFILFLHILDRSVESPKIRQLGLKQQELSMKLSILEQQLGRTNEILQTIENNDDNIYRTYFEVDPLSPTLRNAGFGGKVSKENFRSSRYQDRLQSLSKSLDVITKKLVVQSRSFDEIIEMSRSKEKRMAARPVIQPISINELTRFGSAFGMRLHPILKVRKMHEGIDLTAPRGTPIFATADGVVLQSSNTSGGYGKKIVIDHGYGYRTLYGHCHELRVKKGERVKRGDIIGTVGSTGLSTRPHLHYEVIANGRKVNPIHYYANDLTGEEFENMIRLLSEADPSFDIN